MPSQRLKAAIFFEDTNWQFLVVESDWLLPSRARLRFKCKETEPLSRSSFTLIVMTLVSLYWTTLGYTTSMFNCPTALSPSRALPPLAMTLCLCGTGVECANKKRQMQASTTASLCEIPKPQCSWSIMICWMDCPMSHTERVFSWFGESQAFFYAVQQCTKYSHVVSLFRVSDDSTKNISLNSMMMQNTCVFVTRVRVAFRCQSNLHCYLLCCTRVICRPYKWTLCPLRHKLVLVVVALAK